MNVQNFIGGEFFDAVDNTTLENISPATGQLIGTIPRSKQSDVYRAVAAARVAQHEWAELTLDDRADWLEAIADALESRSEELAELESLDTGKPLSLAQRVDAKRSVENFRFFADFAREQENLIFEMEDATNIVDLRPVGIVGLITPWNLPLYLLSWKVAPALLMGNAIVAKPSELTPLTAHLLAQVCQEIELPDGVLNIVNGYGPEVGQEILEHEGIKAISFPGGTATGRHVAATAAPMFKKLSLELGGKNATIILDDADLNQAVQGAIRAGFTNSGQVCLCGSRILVHESIADEFTQHLVTKVESYINLAIQEGGTVLTGGTRAMTGHPGPTPEGAFLRPTLISGLSHLSRTAREEIFGPVVTIHRFSSDEDAIEMANSTDYGLAGSIWTADTERGHSIAQKIDTGIIWINTWLHRDLRTPFGGVKHSGVGREGGNWSLGFFSEPLNVCIKHD